MTLSEIIKDDKDRLFVIDTECFIIFTGETEKDKDSLLRIGNSYNFPVAAIPHIKQILVPDIPIGSAAVERYNLNMDKLAGTIYIGTNPYVENFVASQQLYEIDISKIDLIDVEINSPQNFSKNESSSIIGLFYTNGQLQVKKDNIVIFDLKKSLEENASDYTLNDYISKRSFNAIYGATGFIPMKNGILIHRQGNFSCVNIEGITREMILKWHLDTSKFREIFQKNEISESTWFFKILNNAEKQIKIFTNDQVFYNVLLKIYKKLKVNQSEYKEIRYKTIEDIDIHQIGKSYSLWFNLNNVKPYGEDITISYIQDFTDIDKAEKLNAQINMITYNVFCDVKPLLSKYSLNKYYIICNYAEAINAFKNSEDVLIEEIPYSILLFESFQALYGYIYQYIRDNELKELFSESFNFNKIAKFYNKHINSKRHIFDLVNAMTLLQILVLTEENSSTRKIIKKIISIYKSKCNEYMLFNETEGYYFAVLCKHREYIFRLFKEPEEPAINFPDYSSFDDKKNYSISEHKKIFSFINKERERLDKLLLLLNSNKEQKKEIKRLEKHIKDKKLENTDKSHSAEKKEIKTAIRKQRLKKTLKYIFLIMFLIALGFGTKQGISFYSQYKKNEIIKKEERRIKKLVKEYNIYVSNTDILKYTNTIAGINGYSKITIKDVNKKNPNWLYPGNIITLLDNEKITVKPGNTMWGIARKKLMKRHIEFYTIINNIKNNSNALKANMLMQKAKKVAFSDRHFSDLNKIKVKNNE